jgi:PAS domain S-box-containing protein
VVYPESVTDFDSPSAPVDVGGRAFAQALAETTESLVCVLDRDGRILLFNEACERATGFTREEVLGRDARESVIPPDQAEMFGEVLVGIWRTRQPSPQVGHWMSKYGDRLLIAWSNRAVLEEDGTVRYVVASGRDITERERAEAEIRALQGDVEAKLGEVGRLAQEQTALRRVATLVASEANEAQIFEAVSRQCARVLGAGSSAVFRFDSDDQATVVGRWDREGIPVYPLGSTVELGGRSSITQVRQTGQPTRIDDYSGLAGPVAEAMRTAGLRATVAAPIVVAGTIWGAVAVATSLPKSFPPESEARLADFCELVSLAIASASAREELRASRVRIVQTADNERRRLERNLHDGAQQRLVALSIALRLARARLRADPASAEALLVTASTDADEAVRELRELARGLHPAMLTEAGLGPALGSLAERATLDVVVHTTPAERLPEQVEAAVYYVVAEALTNATKHARATRVVVRVEHADGVARVEVADDGRGGADASRGSGIVGLRDRVDALGGTLEVESPPGAGTVVRARLPVA